VNHQGVLSEPHILGFPKANELTLLLTPKKATQDHQFAIYRKKLNSGYGSRKKNKIGGDYLKKPLTTAKANSVSIQNLVFT
jgi:hypothetical protein